MALKDLFRPKWEDPDPKVRIAALKEIQDVGILNKVITHDTNENVIQIAWGQIAKYSDFIYYCKKALENLKDQEIIAEVAKNAKDDYVRKEAVDRLINQELIADVVKNSFNRLTKKIALEKLKDSEIIADIAKNNEDEYVRVAAVKKLDSSKWQELLVEIAKNDESENVRKEVVKKIEDQKLLVEIAKKDEEKNVRDSYEIPLILRIYGMFYMIFPSIFSIYVIFVIWEKKSYFSTTDVISTAVLICGIVGFIQLGSGLFKGRLKGVYWLIFMNICFVFGLLMAIFKRGLSITLLVLFITYFCLITLPLIISIKNFEKFD